MGNPDREGYSTTVIETHQLIQILNNLTDTGQTWPQAISVDTKPDRWQPGYSVVTAVTCGPSEITSQIAAERIVLPDPLAVQYKDFLTNPPDAIGVYDYNHAYFVGMAHEFERHELYALQKPDGTSCVGVALYDGAPGIPDGQGVPLHTTTFTLCEDVLNDPTLTTEERGLATIAKMTIQNTVNTIYDQYLPPAPPLTPPAA